MVCINEVEALFITMAEHAGFGFSKLGDQSAILGCESLLLLPRLFELANCSLSFDARGKTISNLNRRKYNNLIIKKIIHVLVVLLVYARVSTCTCTGEYTLITNVTV